MLHSIGKNLWGKWLTKTSWTVQLDKRPCQIHSLDLLKCVLKLWLQFSFDDIKTVLLRITCCSSDWSCFQHLLFSPLCLVGKFFLLSAAGRPGRSTCVCCETRSCCLSELLPPPVAADFCASVNCRKWLYTYIYIFAFGLILIIYFVSSCLGHRQACYPSLFFVQRKQKFSQTQSFPSPTVCFLTDCTFKVPGDLIWLDLHFVWSRFDVWCWSCSLFVCLEVHDSSLYIYIAGSTFYPYTVESFSLDCI